VLTEAKLSILVVTNLYPPQALGGYERAIADFARLLQHRGHSVLVLTTGDEQPFYASHTSAYAEVKVERCLSLGGNWSFDSGAEWFAEAKVVAINGQNSQALAHHLQAFRPDVCLLGSLDFLHVELVEQLLEAQVPVAHYVMNYSPGYAPEWAPRTPLYRYITCSDWVIRSLQEGGYPVDTAQTVYPGAAVAEFYQAELPPQDYLRIAYASLVMPYKGADVLLEALHLLHSLGVPFTATIAGGTFSPAYVETLKQFVAAEELQEHITFPGVLSRQELSQLYKTHNVLAFPSRFQEPFGISQVEAMAAGLTLVTSGMGGAREIVNHGVDGFLFESENPLALADVLISLPAQPAAWEAVTRKGQETALSKFNQAKAADGLEVILRDLVIQVKQV